VKSLEVLFSPAEFSALEHHDLGATVCVVFDVLRATSSMVTALSNGAEAIVPVAGIPEALSLRLQQAEVLLAGEREGVRIPAELTGSVSFDLGNSPREFTKEIVGGRTIVMTTTNGTRALRACAHARKILVSSFLNLGATRTLSAEKLPPVSFWYAVAPTRKLRTRMPCARARCAICSGARWTKAVFLIRR
jgi:2-phosphosulfolactate phosphatase